MKLARSLTVVAAVLAAFLVLSASAVASTINVLWYSGGIAASGSGFATYQDAINNLASLAPGAPGGNTWNVTFWDSGAMPSGSYNVLVVASPEGGWTTNPDYSALESALSGITFGNRLMLTGQDADWHYINSPGPTNFDGPQGFLLDSINWAGSGTGLGLVALGVTGTGTCWSGPNYGFTGYTPSCNETNNVQIPPSESGFPINTNLTSAGLSNWNTAAHVDFYGLDTTKWNGININGDDSCAGAPSACYVTIVSAGTASGGIGGATPEPASVVLFATGLIGLVGFMEIRRRKAFQA
ncbi:MAG TPA: PEP-CTERM sorting domain-containing protein [Terriglobia bacterium]|nr:PEP-CTERM sorting domain-containing protein [Terriglobia bacterium]